MCDRHAIQIQPSAVVPAHIQVYGLSHCSSSPCCPLRICCFQSAPSLVSGFASPEQSQDIMQLLVQPDCCPRRPGERLLYVPSVGYCLFIADILALGLAKQVCYAVDAVTTRVLPRHRLQGDLRPTADQDRPHPVRGNRRTWALALCAAAYWTGMGAKTVQRNREWATELKLFESAMNVCPQSLKVREIAQK